MTVVLLRKYWKAIGLLLFLGTCFQQPGFSQKDIEGKVNRYLRSTRQGGVVLSLIQSDTFSLFSFGSTSKKKDQSIPVNSRFEIGTLGQVFSSILLMVAEQEEVILPGSTLQDYFPLETYGLTFQSLICTQVRTPARSSDRDPVVVCRPDPLQSGSCMTFCELAMHNSGLPLSLESGWDWHPFVELDRWEPSAGPMNRDTFFHRLNRIKLVANPGSSFRYSNIGPPLLGLLLGNAYQTTYDQALEEKVLKPLALSQTTSDQPADIPGHDYKGRETPPTQLEAQSPYGGFTSSAEDLSRLVLQFFNPKNEEWQAVMESVRQERIDVSFPTAPDETLATYGWFSTPLSADETSRVIWQFGGTDGFRAFVGFIPSRKTGVVLLTNQTEDLKDLAFDILRQMQNDAKP